MCTWWSQQKNSNAAVLTWEGLYTAIADGLVGTNKGNRVLTEKAGFQISAKSSYLLANVPG